MRSKNAVNIKKVFGYKMFFVVNIVILVFLGLSFGREFVRSASIKKEIADLEYRRMQLEDKNLSLVAYQDYLNTEAFLENEAREKFGLQKPGEVQVIIDEDVQVPIHEVEPPLGMLAVSTEDVPPYYLWSWYFFEPGKYSEYIQEKWTR